MSNEVSTVKFDTLLKYVEAERGLVFRDIFSKNIQIIIRKRGGSLTSVVSKEIDLAMDLTESEVATKASKPEGDAEQTPTT